jgi:hypothetical protein
MTENADLRWRHRNGAEPTAADSSKQHWQLPSRGSGESAETLLFSVQPLPFLSYRGKGMELRRMAGRHVIMQRTMLVDWASLLKSRGADKVLPKLQ